MVRFCLAFCLSLLLCLPAWAEPLPTAPSAPTAAPTIGELFQEAMAATQQFDFETALRRWDAILRQDPNNAAAYSNRGNALVGLGRLDEAIASYDRSMALLPNQAAAYLNRGTAYEACKPGTKRWQITKPYWS